MPTKMGTMKVRDSVAKSVTETVRQARHRFFEADDFEGSRTAVERTLSRLEAGGDLRRVRKGLYWRGSKSRFGMTRPSSTQVVNHVLKGMSYGLTSFSAANALGLSSQVPAITTIAVAGGAPRDLEDLLIRFVVRSGRRGQARQRLRAEEFALLEVMPEWDDVVELDLESARRRVETLVEQGSLRPAAIAKAARAESRAVRDGLARLGVVGDRELASV